ncbi:type II toxin-antitoxin system VapC family toxin [Synechococcus sp. PCC 6312]|uniref:type II toxin-antitoxin system VapC family toxin n=1 Tax=Synechococcus sp. (strain ATCC 27167 / PCC 6312) TaxID=195253 RepID=UPI00029F15BB|nr:type II toxin-antitoxin system VapC family toxin [Synechococcus sp. PCC 6312]AFY62382.1 hypothetical protein Syn6312_3347 [Synechococcus sp. PCC 6312]
MRILLDTHTFLWFVNNDPQLSSVAKSLIESDVNIWVSVASLWEIAIKVSISKLTLPKPFNEFIPLQLQNNEMDILPIAIPHLNAISTLPSQHRDPFDRLLITQSLVEQVPLVSADVVFDLYGINRIW